MNIVLRNTTELYFKTTLYRCATGRGGIASKSAEGDGITPIGLLPIRKVLYRPDRLPAPHTRLPTAPLKQSDGWCDDPADPAYNRQISLPFSARHENLWRSDHVYDVIAILGFNDSPVQPNKGSAIFLHIARPDYQPTEGCIALAQHDLLDILRHCDPKSQVDITRPGL